MKRITVIVDGVIYRFNRIGKSFDLAIEYIELFPRASRIVVAP